jgi:hypothetical protein
VLLTAVIKQRVNIKFCVQLDKTPTETYEMLQSVYGDEALSRISVFEWFKQFKDGREDIQDDPRSGRPSTFRNADTIANVREMVTLDRRLTLRIILDELNTLTDEQKQGDSHHAKMSSRLVKTIPVFLIAL